MVFVRQRNNHELKFTELQTSFGPQPYSLLYSFHIFLPSILYMSTGSAMGSIASSAMKTGGKGNFSFDTGCSVRKIIKVNGCSVLLPLLPYVGKAKMHRL